MTKWATDRPGQPPRILTEPREDEPLEDEGWQTEHLRAPLSPIAAVLAELEVRYPPSPPANLAEAMGFPFRGADGRWYMTQERAAAAAPATPTERSQYEESQDLNIGPPALIPNPETVALLRKANEESQAPKPFEVGDVVAWVVDDVPPERCRLYVGEVLTLSDGQPYSVQYHCAGSSRVERWCATEMPHGHWRPATEAEQAEYRKSQEPDEVRIKPMRIHFA